MNIRQVKKSELFSVMETEKATWPEGTRANYFKFSSRYATFPYGFFVIKKNKTIAGMATCMIIDGGIDDIKSWELITDNGYIYNHNPAGRDLYVVSVAVHPHFQRQGIGSALIQQQIKLATGLGLDSLILGARVPTLHKIDSDQEKYILSGNDPEIRFYQKNGLVIKKIVQNYMEDDKESNNVGVIMQYII